MDLANEGRIKKRVIRILKANKDAFEGFVATDENSQRRIFDSNDEIDFFVKEADLDFARAVAKCRNHPYLTLYRVEMSEIVHGEPLEPFDGIFLKAKLVVDSNDSSTDIEALLINSPDITAEAAKALVLDARENPDLFGGQDAIKNCFALCDNHAYFADSRIQSGKFYVTDVQRKNDNSLNSPAFCESGIIAGAVRRAMRGGFELEVVKAHAEFEANSLQDVKNGATILAELPDF
jgi:hypothetical protein